MSPIAGVYLVDYYLFSQKDNFTSDESKIGSMKYPAIFSWCIGALVCFITSYDFLNLMTITEISVLDGTLVAAISYVIMQKLFMKASSTAEAM